MNADRFSKSWRSTATTHRADAWPARVAVLVIRLYRSLLSPLLPRTCRFAPSCSAYTAEAIATHGLFFGAWLAVRRLGKCHPYHPGGADPVPSSHLEDTSRKRRKNGSEDAPRRGPGGSRALHLHRGVQSHAPATNP